MRRRIAIDIQSVIRELSQEVQFDPYLVNRCLSFLPGEYESNRLGKRGYEFYDVKPYQPLEDPVSNIHVSLSRRLGKLVSSVFLQERELPVFLLADVSETMCWGEKPILLLKSIALFGSAAFERMNPVGGACLGIPSSVRKPRHSRDRLWTFLEDVMNALGSHSSDAGWRACKDFLSVVDGPSLILVFSDFLLSESLLTASLLEMGVHEIMPIVVHSRYEHVLPSIAGGSFTDLVTGVEYVADLKDEKAFRLWTAEVRRFEKDLAARFLSSGVARAVHVTSPGTIFDNNFLESALYV